MMFTTNELPHSLTSSILVFITCFIIFIFPKSSEKLIIILLLLNFLTMFTRSIERKIYIYIYIRYYLSLTTKLKPYKVLYTINSLPIFIICYLFLPLFVFELVLYNCLFTYYLYCSCFVLFLFVILFIVNFRHYDECL